MRQGKEMPFNYEYKPHHRTFNTPEARMLLFFKLITTQDFEEYKRIYKKLTNYGASEDYLKYSKYVRKNKEQKKFLEVF